MTNKKNPLLNENKLNSTTFEEGFKLKVVESIDSTNSQLKMNLEAYPHKTVLLAEEQISGKGRQNRSFVSNKSKGIYCSVVWKMDFDPIQVHWFSLMTSVAIVEALNKQTSLKFQVKWPNDILLNQKKCGGILIESEISANQKEISFVCGFGINVYHQDFSDELKDKVISIEDVYQKEIDRNDLIFEILKQFNHYLVKPYTDSSKESYEKHLYIPKHFVEIQNQKEVFKAKLLGINDDGTMRCQKENGEILSLTVEEIHFV